MKYTFLHIVSLILFTCGTLQAQTTSGNYADMPMEYGDLEPPSLGVGAEPANEDEIFVYVEEEPKFEIDLDAYFAEHFVVSEAMSTKGRVGLLVLMCIVEKDGSLSEVKVLPGKNLSPLQDAEAIRVMRATSGKWKPGEINGVPVRTRWKYVLRFTETEDEGIVLVKKEVKKPDVITEAHFNQGEINDYIRQHYVVSKKIKKEGRVGTVTVSFNVEADSSVTQVSLSRGPATDQDLELIRVVQSTSKLWTPATLNGKAIRKGIKISYTFTEADLNRKQKKK